MNSKVLLLGQLEYIRKIAYDGLEHGLTQGAAFEAAIDKAEEIAKEDNPLMAMIVDTDKRYKGDEK